MGLEDIGKFMSDKVNDVADKSKVMIAKNKLKGQLKQELGNLNKAYQEIGWQFHSANLDNVPEEYAAEFAKVSAITQNIDRINKEIDLLDSNEEMIVCPKCGAKTEKESRFCSACGSDLQPETVEAEVVSESTDKFCPSCGEKVADGSQFCNKCGVRIEK